MRFAKVVVKVLSVGREGRRSSDRLRGEGGRRSPGGVTLTRDHLVLLH